MSYASLCCLSVLVLLAIALIAAERALRPGHPLGIPSPPQRVVRCQRCGRANLEADLYGRPLPHYPPDSTEELCGPRRIQ